MKSLFALLLLASFSSAALASGTGIGNGRCAEGQRDTEDNMDGTGSTTWICRNGAFTNPSAPSVPESKDFLCHEGDRQYWPTETSTGIVNYWICHRGQYVPANP